MTATTWQQTQATDTVSSLHSLENQSGVISGTPRATQLQKSFVAFSALASVLAGTSVGTSSGVEPFRWVVVRAMSATVGTDLLMGELRTPFASLVESEDQPELITHPNAVPGSVVLGVVQELQGWLGVNRSQVAEIGGFDRRNLSNWSRSGAYPSTIRHMLSVHALVSSIVQALGVDGARTWLAAQTAQLVSRASVAPGLVDLLGDDEKVNALVSAASGLLFVVPARSNQFADMDFDETTEVTSSDTASRIPRAARRVVSKHPGERP